MARLDSLSHEKLVSTLADLTTDITQLKERQRTSGQSGLLSYFSQSANTWDATATVGTPSDTSTITKSGIVQFIGDGSQDIAFVNLSFSLFVNGTDTAHQLTPTTQTWTDGTRTAQIVYTSTNVSHDVVTVRFLLTTLKDVTYYVKAYASGSSRGTLSASLT